MFSTPAFLSFMASGGTGRPIRRICAALDHVVETSPSYSEGSVNAVNLLVTFRRTERYRFRRVIEINPPPERTRRHHNCPPLRAKVSP